MDQAGSPHDILHGASAIAAFLGVGSRRAVYDLVKRKKLKVFRLGGMICARRSVLLANIERQEQAATGS